MSTACLKWFIKVGWSNCYSMGSVEGLLNTAVIYLSGHFLLTSGQLFMAPQEGSSKLPLAL